MIESPKPSHVYTAFVAFWSSEKWDVARPQYASFNKAAVSDWIRKQENAHALTMRPVHLIYVNGQWRKCNSTTFPYKFSSVQVADFDWQAQMIRDLQVAVKGFDPEHPVLLKYAEAFNANNLSNHLRKKPSEELPSCGGLPSGRDEQLDLPPNPTVDDINRALRE